MSLRCSLQLLRPPRSPLRSPSHHRAGRARRRVGSDRAGDAAGAAARGHRAHARRSRTFRAPPARSAWRASSAPSAATATPLMVSGLIMLGGIVTHRSPVTLGDVVPIARLTGEYEVIAVPAASPFRTLARPDRARSRSGPSRSPGAAARPAAATRSSRASSPTRSASRRAASTTSRSRAAASRSRRSRRPGVGRHQRPRGVRAADRGRHAARARDLQRRAPARLDAPTLREQGVDVEFENWRSVVAPPGISRGGSAPPRRRRSTRWSARAKWHEMLDALPVARPLSGRRRVRAFATAEEMRVRAILRKLGTGDSDATSLAEAGPYPLFVLAGLAIFAVARRDQRARGASRATPTPSQPKLAIARPGWRRHRPQPRAGRARGVRHRVGHALLVVARAFDQRHPVRDAAFAVARVRRRRTCSSPRLLQLPLPAGVLAAAGPLISLD